eukprot:755772-Hanusia_phi.AAC.4
MNLSADVKQARAMSAARFVTDQAPVDEDEIRRDPFREMYEWLKEESLHEHLPSLLGLGVCHVRLGGELTCSCSNALHAVTSQTWTR